MLNKLIADFNKVLSKADEVRNSVAQQAAKAREAWALPKSNQQSSHALERTLENQITQATSISQLHDIYVRWIAQIVTSAAPEATRYYDSAPASASSVGALALDIAFGLGNNAFDKTLSSAKNGLPLGDICSSTSWISPTPPNSPSTESSGLEISDEKTACDSKVIDIMYSLTETEGLTFREVFLRSQVLELALISLARMEGLRARFMAPLIESPSDSDSEASTRGALQRLLSLSMAGEPRVHQELLFLLCSVDLRSDSWEIHLRHLAELIAILKNDWLVDLLTSKKRRLQEDIETLRYYSATVGNEALDYEGLEHSKVITALGSHDSSKQPAATSLDENSDSFKKPSILCSNEDKSSILAQRSAMSLRIVDLLAELEITASQLEKRSMVVREKRQQRLEQLLLSVESLCLSFSNIGSQAVDRSEHVTTEMANSAREVEQKWNAAQIECNALDVRLTELENQRKAILSELDAVNQKIADMHAERQQASQTLRLIDQNKARLAKTFERKVAVATELLHQSNLQKVDMENIKKVVVQAETLLKKDGEGCIAEPQKQKILMYEAAALNHLTNEAERLDYEKSSVQSSLIALQELWNLRLDKQLVYRELQAQFQLEHEAYLQTINEQKNKEDDLVNRSEEEETGNINNSAFKINTDALEQLAERYREARNAVILLDDQINQAQRQALRCIDLHESVWKDLNEFVDSKAPFCAVEKLSDLHDNERCSNVEQGNVIANLNATNTTVQDREKIEIESKASELIAQAHSVYAKAKQDIASKAEILGLVNKGKKE